MNKYRSNIIVDASQEYVGVSADSAEGRRRWADSAKINIQFFRSNGYTHPLEVMSNFEGRDLAAIVEYGNEIRSVDAVTVQGYPQTMFGWQAYWSGSWYPAWQGSLLVGPDQSLSATEAIRSIVPAQNFPIEVGIDNYPDDTSTQYESQINQAAVEGVSWLWWVWDRPSNTVLCPESGAVCADFVTKNQNGFSGAKPLSP